MGWGLFVMPISLAPLDFTTCALERVSIYVESSGFKIITTLFLSIKARGPCFSSPAAYTFGVNISKFFDLKSTF